MRERIVLIGEYALSLARSFIADLVLRDVPCDLVLVDANPDDLAITERLTRKMIEAKQAPIILHADADRRHALPEATAIICMQMPGGAAAWQRDIEIPRKYGIYQSIGDNVMPGGISRALRALPPMIAVAEDVLDLAPNALFITCSDPMSAICRAVRKITGAPIVGLCSSVLRTAQYLAGMLGVHPALLQYTAIGLNHLTWLTNVRVHGQDQMPRLYEIAAQQMALLSRVPQDDVLLEDLNLFSWRLLQIFGGFPAILDRHISEFFPHCFPGGRYYGKTLGVDVFSFEQTISFLNDEDEELREVALSDSPIYEDYFTRTAGRHGDAIEVLEWTRQDAGLIRSATLPNTGQVPNLPPDAIIECPAIVNAAGVHPVAQAPLPPELLGTLVAKIQEIEVIVDAALEGNRDKVIQAMMLDGSVASPETACQLTDDLLAAHAVHLPQFHLATAAAGAGHRRRG